MKSQRFYLPADISSGAYFSRGEPRPYAVRARLTPALGFGKAGRLRIGAEVVGVYENPKWFSGFGPSATVRVWSSPLEEVGVLAVVDHMWWEGDRPSSGAALVFDLDGMFRIGARLDRDWLEQSTSPQVSLGADIPNILKVLGGHRSGAPHLPLSITPRRGSHG